MLLEQLANGDLRHHRRTLGTWTDLRHVDICCTQDLCRLAHFALPSWIAAASWLFVVSRHRAQPLLVGDACRPKHGRRGFRVGTDLFELLPGRGRVLLGHGRLEFEYGQVHRQGSAADRGALRCRPSKLASGQQRQDCAVDGVPQRIQRIPTIFLAGTEKECDVRIAIHQGLKRHEERRNGAARLFLARERAGELVELPQQPFPSIEQRKLRHDGGRLRSRGAGPAFGLDQGPFGPRAPFDQGIELRLVDQHLAFVQQQAVLGVEHSKRERPPNLQDIANLREWDAIRGGHRQSGLSGLSVGAEPGKVQFRPVCPGLLEVKI